MNIGILGGGLSGVTLQRFLKHDSEILEKEDRVGGLCRTFYKDGFYYDIGGHILFSKNNELLEFIQAVLDKNVQRCRRSNKVFYKDRFIKYPFENGLGMLDKEDIYECLIGYLENKHPRPKNYLEWIYYTFGDGIAEKYLIPYSQKIWKEPLQHIGLEWVERVPRPPVEDIIKSALGIETEGYVHQLYFYYPLVGGIEGLIQAIKKRDAEITTGFEINKICRRVDKWFVSDGKQEKWYDKIVITMPVKETIKCLENVPQKVMKASADLRHNMVRVVLIGVNNTSLLDKSAIYIAQSDVVCHRVCYMGYFSKHNMPDNTSSLIAEVTTHRNHCLYDISDDSIIDEVVNNLHAIGMIDKKDIIVTDIKNIEYGYVVYDQAYQKNISIIRDYFASLGIIMHGRFGKFEYINMDEAMQRSMQLAGRLNAQ